MISRVDMDRNLYWSSSGPVTAEQIRNRVSALSEKLPDLDAAALSFGRRDCFLTALLSVWSRGQTAVLPAKSTAYNPKYSRCQFSSLYFLSDNPCAISEAENSLIDSTLAEGLGKPSQIEFDPKMKALCMFTSGSTGRPVPNFKTCESLINSAVPIAAMVGLDRLESLSLVATVPIDHMYGFELTALMVLWAGLSAHCERPIYPDDIARCLRQIPAPRVLVTTPFHLRILMESEVKLPALHKVISATAPLSAEFATRLEDWLCAPIQEIYGFTEGGSVASRRTVDNLDWTLRSDLTPDEFDGQQFLISRDTEQRIPFPDSIRILDNSHIQLESRHQDIVKIAGKRESLSNLSSLLAQIDGVKDGIYAMSSDDSGMGTITRLIAIVVAPGVTDQKIRQSLRKNTDDVFLPRKIYRVPSLPRNETGKLPHEDLQTLISAVLKRA